jgi:GTP-binding protein
VKGGDGGNGCNALRKEFRLPRGGPCGGNGGAGGNIFLECDKTLNSLVRFQSKMHYESESGKHGLGSSRHGIV